MFGAVDVRCLSKYAGTKKLAKANPDADLEHPFYGAKVVFTGALSWWMRTDGLSGKRRKAADLAVSGVEIQILTEAEFEAML